MQERGDDFKNWAMIIDKRKNWAMITRGKHLHCSCWHSPFCPPPFHWWVDPSPACSCPAWNKNNQFLKTNSKWNRDIISCFDVMRSNQSSAFPCLRQHPFAANIASWCSLSVDCYIAETIRRVIWILASDTVFANSRNLSTNIETAMPFTASWCSLSPDCYAETAANRLKHCHTLLLLPQILWSVFASLWIWENISIFLLLFSLNKSIKRFRLLQTI